MDVSNVRIFVRACVNFGILGNLGIDVQELIEFYKECLMVARYFEDDHTVCLLYFQLGQLNGEKGFSEEALNNFEECLNVADKMRDKNRTLNAFIQKGKVYMDLKKYDEVIECFLKGLDISKEIGDKERERDCSSVLGWVYCKIGKLEEGIVHHERYLCITLQIGDEKKKLEAYTESGMFYDEIGQYQKAVEKWRKGLECVVCNTGEITPESLGYAYHLDSNDAIEIYKRALARNIAMGYMKIGVAYREKEKFEESIKSCEESINIAQTIEDREVEMKANFFLGSAYRDLVQPDKAIAYYVKSLEISQKVEDKEVTRYSLLNLGLLYKMLGELQNAITHFKHSLAICRELEVSDRDGEAACLVDLGIVYKMLGEYHKASEYYKESLGIYIEAGDKEGQGVVYMDLGCVQWAAGEQLDANMYFEKALNLFKEIDCKNRQIELYGIIGAFYTEIGKYNEAIMMTERSLELSKQNGNRKGENNAKKELVPLFVRVSKFQKAKECLESLKFELIENDKAEAQSFYYDLGAIFQHMGKQDNALEMFKMSLDIAKEIGKRDSEGNTYRELGDTCSLMGNFDDAIQYCEKSLSIAKEIKDKIIEASAYRTLGSVYRRRSNDKKDDEKNRQADKERSIQFLSKALDLWDLVFDNLKEKDDFKVSIVDTYVGTYDELVSVLIEKKQFEKALLVCDRGRARALGDLLVKKYNLLSNPDTARCRKLEIDDVQKLFQKSNFCVLQFAFYEDLAVVWVISQENEQISIELETIAVNKETLQSEKGQLGDINFLCSQAISAVYRTMKNNGSTKCENRSMEFLKIDQGEGADGITEIKESMDVAFVKRDTAPEEGESDGGEEETDPLELLYTALLDSVLNNIEQDDVVIIPHGHLYRVPFAALKDPKTKRFLSENKRIRLAPSLTTLKSIQDCPDNYHCKTGALIVGDPDVGDAKLFRLPEAKKEAEIIAENLNVEPLTGSEATKEMVKQKLREGVALIHIAAHGDSENGRIALAPPKQTGPTSTPEEQDYMLTMHEVQEIGVRAQLVVLSCCHSGRGEIRAEGVVGMSRAFLAAGARAVIASLWAIDDTATLSIMLSFYTYLQMGKSASESLQDAMKEVREEGYDEPKYWSPFFLIGDDVTISL